MYTLSVYIAGEIGVFENLDTVHITMLGTLGRELMAANGSKNRPHDAYPVRWIQCTSECWGYRAVEAREPIGVHFSSFEGVGFGFGAGSTALDGLCPPE